jgi:hypothetical protein
MLVGGIIVEHQMQLQLSRYCPLYIIEPPLILRTRELKVK